jgi:hypothetical protein
LKGAINTAKNPWWERGLGADVDNDWKSLGFEPKSLTECFHTKDIQSFFRDFKNQPLSLSCPSEHFLGENMYDGTHSSIADARITAICYKKMKMLLNQGFVRFSCPVMDEI